MSMRKIAFWVGLFSLVVGLLTYDSELPTAPIPVVSGLIVVLLAVFNLIPEFTVCEICGKKSPKKKTHCIHCGADLQNK